LEISFFRDGPLNNRFKSVILTTNEIKLCSDLLASFSDELRQALQICRGAYGSQEIFGAKQLLPKSRRRARRRLMLRRGWQLQSMIMQIAYKWPRPSSIVEHSLAWTCDAQREYAYGPALGLPDTRIGAFPQSLHDEAKRHGWFVISMKSDWSRIWAFEQ